MDIRKNVVIVEDSASGKTSLTFMFEFKEFPESYIPTLLDEYFIDIKMHGFTVNLHIIDTAGDDDDIWLRYESYKDADVIIMCFSIDNPAALTIIEEKWFPEVKLNCPTAPIMLVGNKTDLRADTDELAKKGHKLIKEKDGQAMAEKIGAYAYLECSAKLNEGITEVFKIATLAKIEVEMNEKKGKKHK